MAKYIKQEMPDIHGTGEVKCYYRMETKGNMHSDELIEKIAHPGSGLSKGSVAHVLESFIYELAKAMANGYSVTMDGVGTFRSSLGMRKDKEMDSLEGEEGKRNAVSIRINGVNFKADKALIKEMNNSCRLSRGGTRKIKRSKYTKEERLRLALDFLSNNHNPFMRVRDYAELTGMSRTTASRELNEFAKDRDSGITFAGNKSAKVYLPLRSR